MSKEPENSLKIQNKHQENNDYLESNFESHSNGNISRYKKYAYIFVLCYANMTYVSLIFNNLDKIYYIN